MLPEGVRNGRSPLNCCAGTVAAQLVAQAQAAGLCTGLAAVTTRNAGTVLAWASAPCAVAPFCPTNIGDGSVAGLWIESGKAHALTGAFNGVEGKRSYVVGGLSRTFLIPVTPVALSSGRACARAFAPWRARRSSLHL